MMNFIREFQPSDIHDMYPIYTYYVEHTDQMLESEPISYKEFEEQMCHIAQEHPFYVGLADGVLIGYGYVDLYRNFDAVRQITVCFVPGKHYGLPKQMLEQLERDSKLANVRWLYICVSDQDGSSVAFYQDNGYAIAGRIPECYQKDEAWLGYVWLHKDIQVSQYYRVAKSAVVTGDVRLGKDVSVWHQAIVRGDSASITIGDGSNVQDGSILHVDAEYPLVVGKSVTIGHGAIVHGATVEDEVLIGMGAIVMNGAHIGKHSMIGAGAVVTEGKEIPEGSIVVGCPGKIIGQVDDQKIESIRENAQEYVEQGKKSL